VGETACPKVTQIRSRDSLSELEAKARNVGWDGVSREGKMGARWELVTA
jgi:hypothetical protein